ncbi:unnamed protein product [Rhizopus stolonifer]
MLPVRKNNHSFGIQAKATSIVQQTLTSGSVLFLLPANLFKQCSNAYQAIESHFGDVNGFRIFSRYNARNKLQLLIVVKFSDSANTRRAVSEGFVHNKRIFKGSPSLAQADRNLSRLQFTLLHIPEKSRLLGEKNMAMKKPSLTEERSSYTQALNNPDVVKELEKGEAIIKEEINDLQKQISLLTNEIKTSLKEEANIEYSKQKKKKDLKMQWNNESNAHHKGVIFNKIQTVKQSEYKAFSNITRIRNELKIKKKLQYIKRMVLRRSKLLQTELGKEKLSVEKDASIRLCDLAYSDYANENTLFSGTDNGIITMKKTTEYGKKIRKIEEICQNPLYTQV